MLADRGSRQQQLLRLLLQRQELLLLLQHRQMLRSQHSPTWQSCDAV
jgi:hypothetical protein